jgi:hypothetical protein
MFQDYQDVLNQNQPTQEPKQEQAQESCSCSVRVRLTMQSGNKKTGSIPVSISESETCPTSCPFYNAGCYADYGNSAIHFKTWRFDKAATNYDQFLEKIQNLPKSQIWRHNEAGDLAGNGESIDQDALAALVHANEGKRGFTYSHKALTSEQNIALVQYANNNGFTVNASCETLEQIELANSAGVPACLTVSENGPQKIKTESGTIGLTCPNELNKSIQCDRCQLCAKSGRKFFVIFHAHGSGKAKIKDHTEF